MCAGLPQWLRRLRICLQCRRCEFDHWVGKIPWRRKWLPTPVFLPGKSHRQRSLLGYIQSMGLQRVGREWVTKQQKCFLQLLKQITTNVLPLNNTHSLSLSSGGRSSKVASLADSHGVAGSLCPPFPAFIGAFLGFWPLPIFKPAV